MKYLILLSLIFCVSISCKNESKTLRDQAPAPNTSITAPAATNTSGVVQHYICPKACAGSGGDSAGTCPVCGSAYQHNQAYHNQPQTSTNSNEGLSPIIQQPAGSTTTPAATTAEPAQNDAGVWHYTCNNGCAGGAGSAIACASCGSTLAHNQAYHN